MVFRGRMQLMQCHNDAQQSEDGHSCKPINTKSALLHKWEVTAMTKHCSWPASKGQGRKVRAGSLRLHSYSHLKVESSFLTSVDLVKF